MLISLSCYNTIRIITLESTCSLSIWTAQTWIFLMEYDWIVCQARSLVCNEIGYNNIQIWGNFIQLIWICFNDLLIFQYIKETKNLRCVWLGPPVRSLSQELSYLVPHHVLVGGLVVNDLWSPLRVLAQLSGADEPKQLTCFSSDSKYPSGLWNGSHLLHCT